MAVPTGKLKYAYETIRDMDSKIITLKALLNRASTAIVEAGYTDFDGGLIDAIEKEID